MDCHLGLPRKRMNRQNPIMKTLNLLGLSALIFVISCGSETKDADGSSRSMTDRVADSMDAAGSTAADWTRKAGSWMDNAWESIKTSSAENTEQVQDSLAEAQVKINEQIEIAQQKAKELSGAAKVQVEKGIAGLKKAGTEISDASSRVSDATAEQWPAIQKEMADAWNQAAESMKLIWQAAGDGDSSEEPPMNSVETPSAK